MKPRSVRGRVTAWYLLVLSLATGVLVAGGWVLLAMSIREAGDRALNARLDGVRQFIANVQHITDPEDIRDEFREYAELTMGDALLEVIDDAGGVLCRPTVPWWPTLASAAVRTGTGATPIVSGVTVDGRPFRVAAVHLVVDGSPYQVTVAAPMAPASAALSRFGVLLAILVPAILALAAAGGYWVSRRSLEPVDRMTRTAQAITLRSLDRRIEVPPVDDEVGRLAITFNDMLGRLEAAVADIVRFTAEASHELRTPVAVIRTAAEVALERPRTPEQYQRTLADIVTETDRMSRVVADLLILARLDAGVDSEGREMGNLALATRQAVGDGRVMAGPLGVTVDASVDDRPLRVRVSTSSLVRTVLILLDNAIKYSPAGGVVRVRLECRAPDRATLVVEDEGPGIDAADEPRIFDRFYRGQAARAGGIEGHGLGLAIARTIVDRAGGTIAQVTPGTGRGCRMEVTLPLLLFEESGGTFEAALDEPAQ